MYILMSAECIMATESKFILKRIVEEVFVSDGGLVRSGRECI